MRERACSLWFAVCLMLSLSGCNEVHSPNGIQSFVAETIGPGVMQSTRINTAMKTLDLRIVRHRNVRGHGGATVSWKGQHITVPIGWAIRVSATDGRGQLSVVIIPYEKNTRHITASLGTSLTATSPGKYVVVSNDFGASGSVLDYITVSRAVTSPSVSPG